MSATVLDIEIERGDTRRHTIRVLDKDTKAPINISTWSMFKLTVASEKSPADDTTKLEEMTGVISSGGADGRVHFIPAGSLGAGTHFYDMQALDSNAEKVTVCKGKYKVIQDITK